MDRWIQKYFDTWIQSDLLQGKEKFNHSRGYNGYKKNIIENDSTFN